MVQKNEKLTKSRKRNSPRGPLGTFNALSAPDPREASAIAEAVNRLVEKTPAVSIANPDSDEQGPIHPHSDIEGWRARLCQAFGTGSFDFARCGLAEFLLLYEKPLMARAHTNAALAVLDGLKPANEIEAMLATQMYSTYALALEFMGRTTRAQQIPQFESTGNMAVKLMRTFTAQVEALAKLRRGGEQTVRVEHVHVYEGGQAVVGNVTHHANRGGGRRNGNGEQPYAPDDPRALAFAPGSPVWGEDPQRDAVPVAEGARPAAVPDARRGAGKRRTARPAQRELSPRLRDQEGG
jgi:hypothetical protein